MAHVVWLVLKNGRSVIAGCDRLNGEAFQSLMGESHRWLTLTGEGSVRFIRGDEIREFRLFDAEFPMAMSSSIDHGVPTSLQSSIP